MQYCHNVKESRQEICCSKSILWSCNTLQRFWEILGNFKCVIWFCLSPEDQCGILGFCPESPMEDKEGAEGTEDGRWLGRHTAGKVRTYLSVRNQVMNTNSLYRQFQGLFSWLPSSSYPSLDWPGCSVSSLWMLIPPSLPGSSPSSTPCRCYKELYRSARATIPRGRSRMKLWQH